MSLKLYKSKKGTVIIVKPDSNGDVNPIGSHNGISLKKVEGTGFSFSWQMKYFENCPEIEIKIDNNLYYFDLISKSLLIKMI